MSRTRIVFSGSGGQGIITAAIVFAESAVLFEGLNAVQTQSYGAAARGGSSRADIILSEHKINYPMVNQPNILVCLTQESYSVYAPTIRPGGLLLTDSRFVSIERKVDAVQRELPMFETVMKNIGSSIVFNICMLGALLGITRLIKTESLLAGIHKRMGASALDLNQHAFELGLELGRPFAE